MRRFSLFTAVLAGVAVLGDLAATLARHRAIRDRESYRETVVAPEVKKMMATVAAAEKGEDIGSLPQPDPAAILKLFEVYEKQVGAASGWKLGFAITWRACLAVLAISASIAAWGKSSGPTIRNEEAANRVARLSEKR